MGLAQTRSAVRGANFLPPFTRASSNPPALDIFSLKTQIELFHASARSETRRVRIVTRKMRRQKERLFPSERADAAFPIFVSPSQTMSETSTPRPSDRRRLMPQRHRLLTLPSSSSNWHGRGHRRCLVRKCLRLASEAIHSSRVVLTNHARRVSSRAHARERRARAQAWIGVTTRVRRAAELPYASLALRRLHIGERCFKRRS